MNTEVYLLWFVKQMPTEMEDVELLIGVYSSDSEAKAAIDRVKVKRGFANFQEGFQIHPYELNRDSWLEGFIVD